MASGSVGGIPMAAIIFMAVIGTLLLMLFLFCMFINKMLCFSRCGGFDCLEEKKESKKNQKKAQLGESYGYEDDDSSSDSDNEMLLRYEHFVSSTYNNKGAQLKKGSFKKKSTALLNGGAAKSCSTVLH